MKSYTIEEDTIQPLVPAITSASTPPPSPARARPKLTALKRVFSRLQLSGAACVILLWNAFVGATYGIVFNGGLALGFVLKNKYNESDSHPDPGFHPALYTFLGAIMFISTIQFFLYPVGGLIADIWCGRHKIMVLSSIKIWCGYGSLIILIFLLAFTECPYEIHRTKNGATMTDFQVINIGLAGIIFIIGFTGFQANVVQFGLDQFLDAPSEKLSLFLHWFVWTDTLGQAIMTVMTSLIPCVPVMLRAITYLPVAIFTILTLVMIVSWYKRKWFHNEPRTKNPYGTVYRVLRFAAKRDRPLRPRSAMTYCDDERPTRIEFAKQRFGGPFTTETVEDVKTFLRILVMLVAIGPTYVVLVAARYVFPLHGIYSGHGTLFTDDNTCKGLDWVVLASGNLTYFVSVIYIPLYVLILPCVKKYLPKIVSRIGIGIVLLLLADISMTLTQLAGYYHFKGKNLTCLFNTDYHGLQDNTVVTLGLPSWTLIVPNILDGLAMPIIYISILEFISAQSPHSMKGVLLGVFYAVRGLFTVVGCVLVFPFASPGLWDNKGGLFDCGFSYYFVSVLLGLIGVGLFCVAARWYQYRVREEQPYGPRYVEAYYQRYIGHCVASEPSEPAVRRLNNSILDYGTVGVHT